MNHFIRDLFNPGGVRFFEFDPNAALPAQINEWLEIAKHVETRMVKVVSPDQKKFMIVKAGEMYDDVYDRACHCFGIDEAADFEENEIEEISFERACHEVELSKQALLAARRDENPIAVLEALENLYETYLSVTRTNEFSMEETGYTNTTFSGFLNLAGFKEDPDLNASAEDYDEPEAYAIKRIENLLYLLRAQINIDTLELPEDVMADIAAFLEENYDEPPVHEPEVIRSRIRRVIRPVTP